jgi:hypothetical protein
MLGNSPVSDRPIFVQNVFFLPSVHSSITQQTGWDRATLADHDTAPNQESSEYTAIVPTMSKHESAHDRGWQPLEETQHPAVCKGTFHCGIPVCSTAPRGPPQSIPK